MLGICVESLPDLLYIRYCLLFKPPAGRLDASHESNQQTPRSLITSITSPGKDNWFPQAQPPAVSAPCLLLRKRRRNKDVLFLPWTGCVKELLFLSFLSACFTLCLLYWQSLFLLPISLSLSFLSLDVFFFLMFLSVCLSVCLTLSPPLVSWISIWTKSGSTSTPATDLQ